MKHLNKSKWLLLSFLLIQPFLKSFAQSTKGANDLHLRSHHHNVLIKYPPAFVGSKHLSSALYQNQYFVLLQFEKLLDDFDRSLLKSMGIYIRDYIPNASYVASVPINIWQKKYPQKNGWYYLKEKMGLEHIGLLHPVDKLSDQLYLQVKALPDYSQEVIASIHVDVSLKEAYYDLRKQGFTVSNQLITGSNELKIKIKNLQLVSLTRIPYIRFVNAIPQPSDRSDVIGESLSGRAFHGTGFVGSIHGADFVPYDGDGITVALDDLGTFNHEDFRGRFEDNTSDIEESAFQSHGAMTTGVLAGAGNLDPRAIGIAPGVEIQYFSNRDSSVLPIENAIANFNNYDISVTNMSLSEFLSDYTYPGNYTEVASELDNVAILEPRIARFMSAGNEGNDENFSLIEDFRDNDDTHYGNITGSMKAAKNVIAVGNVSNRRILEINSSTGPTLDGRIKPDISAMGIGQATTSPFNSYQGASGTSAASPTAAGVGALLQQAYKDIYSDLPNFALLKGIMLNTADDAGRPGPDFEFGYGIINARRAFEVIKNGTFLSGTYSNGDGVIQLHLPEGIPKNISQLKIMLIWLDPGAAPQATKALVNDLDMSLTIGSTNYLPWVLTSGSTIFDDQGIKISGPNLDDVTKPAIRGYDHLNNMEQITVDAPRRGSTYSINISATLPNGGSQEYYLVYSFVEDELTLTYPNGGESLAPNTIETIHWDIPFAYDQDITLEYSIDDNESWTEIATDIPADQQYYQWRVPRDLTGKVRIRISSSLYSDESDEKFHILGIPANLSIEKSGRRSAIFSWDPVEGATSYEVFRLGDKYMESFDIVTQTSVEIENLQEDHSNWYSVRANNESLVGQRAVAIEYRHASGGIWYVDEDAQNNNGGTSWSDAFTDLQDAFDAAAYGDQIWVAAGVYKATRIRDVDLGKDDASWRARFEMRSGLELYGGFAGNESSVEDRSFYIENGVRQLSNQTILSGDIDGDGDGDIYTVVLSNNVNSSALLDGFTITGGNSYGAGGLNRESGGGLYLIQSRPRIQNCRFEGNRASQYGGAVHVIDYSDVVFRNCVFSSNYTDGYGGAIDISSNSRMVIENSYFTDNEARSGAGIHSDDSEVTIRNSTFTGNLADYRGGGFHARGVIPYHIENTLFSENTALLGSAIYSTGSLDLINCTIADNTATNTWNNGSILNKGDAMIVNTIIWGNKFPNNNLQTLEDISNTGTLSVSYSNIEHLVEIDDCQDCNDQGSNKSKDPVFMGIDDYRLDESSPLIDQGINEVVTLATDLAGEVRIQGTVEMGAYEWGDGSSRSSQSRAAIAKEPEDRIDQELFSSQIQLYPIPASDQITIQNGSSESITGYRMVDLNGRVVIEDLDMNLTTGQSIQVNTTQLSPGFYVFTLISEKQTRKVKVLINNR